MNVPARFAARPSVTYPESDGLPMADNTLQFRLMVTIQGGLDVLFRDNPDVFIAGDLLWYPVEGDNKTRQAPDLMVAFGRPKGDRGSYLQWEEDNIPPQVVFEILSPSNRVGEMVRKWRFYERYGVEEFYIYDPDVNVLACWRRVGSQLEEVPDLTGWVSPRLGIRFDLSADELRVIGPDGKPFPSFVELATQWEQAQREKEQAQREKEQVQREADEARQRAERLAAQLRALGQEPQL